jgi:hypothetical protein
MLATAVIESALCSVFGIGDADNLVAHLLCVRVATRPKLSRVKHALVGERTAAQVPAAPI